jgi:hypothetical protein
MSLVFCDSFDHYDDLSLKWTTSGSNDIDLTGTLSRTGIGCCVLTNAFGPVLSVPPLSGVSAGSGYIVGTAFYQLGDGSTGVAIAFIDIDNVLHDITFLWQMGVNASLGLTCIDAFNQSPPQFTSAPNILVPNSYNYLEAKVFFAKGTGSAVMRVNGQVVLNLQNINTLDPSRSSTGGECNNIRLGGVGSGGGTRHDDVYVCNTAGSQNNDFLGAVNIYAVVPSANSTPLQWTPLSGTNFSEVNEIPPDGDTSYVFSSTPGNVDEYIYPVIADLPPLREVFGVQHSLCSTVPSGSASIASAVNGIAASGFGVGSIYHYVPIQPYDFNPNTGIEWKLTDFPGTTLGPKQTL